MYGAGIRVDGWVHPHVRGDNVTTSCIFSRARGPPPRAWGQQGHRDQPERHLRSTPTCVGTTRTWQMETSVCRVHPHVRGDNDPSEMLTAMSPGPPPRAWGQLLRDALDGLLTGSTPTCVGTTRLRKRGRRRDEVHPHVRGDNLRSPGAHPRGNGPPPRAWGQHRLEQVEKATAGSTPTCVGTTTPNRCAGCARTVHPHVRGDNGSAGSAAGVPLGPPPRAWGQPDRGDLGLRRGGSTPTCVGTTAAGWPACDGVQVHPHVRGDNCGATGRSRLSAGPPPRAWGQQPRDGLPAMASRSTPTCVGTTAAPRAAHA